MDSRRKQEDRQVVRLMDLLLMTVMAAFIALSVAALASNAACNCHRKIQDRVPQMQRFKTIPYFSGDSLWT